MVCRSRFELCLEAESVRVRSFHGPGRVAQTRRRHQAVEPVGYGSDVVRGKQWRLIRCAVLPVRTCIRIVADQEQSRGLSLRQGLHIKILKSGSIAMQKDATGPS